MSDPVFIKSGWHWIPTWTLAPDPSAPDGPWIPTWSGWEYLHDAEGNLVREPFNRGTVGRQAPPPDRPVPTREEMAANRARKGLPPLTGGAA